MDHGKLARIPPDQNIIDATIVASFIVIIGFLHLYALVLKNLFKNPSICICWQEGSQFIQLTFGFLSF